MNKKRLLTAGLVLAVASLACNIQSAVTPIPPSSLPPVASNTAPAVSTDTPAPVSTNTVPAVTTAPGGLTLDMLKNGKYHTPVYGRTITLVDGKYSEGSGTTAFSVQMLDVYSLGDLNGDGKADAAVILAENGGGSGVFESLVVLTAQNGTAQQAGAAQLGDRVQIKSVDISSGVVHLDMLVQGPSDPLCCPSLAEKQNYWLIGNALWLMRVTTTVSGTDRIINVDAPGIWSTVTNPFTVSGSVTVLPFENNLAYKIFTTSGTLVNQGSVMVNPTSGTAGTFSQNFDLSSAGISDWVIIQFVDVSAADGSTQSLGSVILKAH